MADSNSSLRSILTTESFDRSVAASLTASGSDRTRDTSVHAPGETKSSSSGAVNNVTTQGVSGEIGRRRRSAVERLSLAVRSTPFLGVLHRLPQFGAKPSILAAAQIDATRL